MNKHKEALKKIVEVTLAQSTANKIATEALQSESEQPKSESRMYSEDEVCGFAEWFTTEDYIHRGMEDGEWFYRGVLHTKEELLRIYLNSLQPTEPKI